MTVSVSDGRVDYAGNGTTTAFSTTFKVLTASDVSVWLVQPDPADASLEIETLQSAYTVSNLGLPAATVTMVTPPAAGERLIIERAQPFTQDADYVANDLFSADQHETALDKLAMQIQRLNAEMEYKLSYPHLSQKGSFNTDLPVPDDNTVLGWQGGQIVNKTIGSSDAIQVIRRVERRHYGSELTAQNRLTLVDIVLPLGINGQIVVVSGAAQREGIDYTVISATVIEFLFDAADDDEIDVYSQEFTTTAGGDAGTITYTPAGAGAVATNVQTALRNLTSLPTATTAQLEDITSAINTTEKVAQKLVRNTTTNLIVYADDATAGGHWYSMAGADTHTPV